MSDDYQARWADLRRRTILSAAAMFSWPLLALGTPFWLRTFLGPLPDWLTSASVAFWLLAIAGLNTWRHSFRCPGCGERFFSRHRRWPFGKACRNCGLERGEDPGLPTGGVDLRSGMSLRKRLTKPAPEAMPLWIRIAVTGVTVAMLAVFFYGFAFYPDAPLKPCGDAFCGKTGHLHSLAEYQAFARWEGLLWTSWLIGMPVVAGYAAIAGGKHRSRP